MKLSTLITCSALALSAVLWHSPAAAGSPQDTMSTCNAAASAKGLTGDARSSFMSDCLGAKPAAAAPPMTPQGQMTACNKYASAKSLTGDKRKSFMSACLQAK
jgi:hypothetical protein